MKKLLYKLTTPITIWWSNYYWRKHNTDEPLRLCDFKHKDESNSDFLVKISKRLHDKFQYTRDGIEQLGDTTPPPPEAYRQFKNGLLKDDCDGYHSALYHIATKNNIECRLLTILSTKNDYGHCVLAFRDNHKWLILDYVTILSYEQAQIHYEDVCGEMYTYTREYDYDKHKLIKNGDEWL